jgi:ketosteroid isomerase-like protein
MTEIYNTPQDAEDAFYDALEEGDLGRLLALWADADDISCLLPMYPMIQGRQQVEEMFHHLPELWRADISGGQVIRDVGIMHLTEYANCGENGLAFR